MITGKRVLVAMSGGMDSAVAAALLKTQGYEVIGVHVQLWERAETRDLAGGGACCSFIDPDQIRKLCDKLGIACYIVDGHDHYQHDVIDYIVHECLAARVPNPCVLCNGSVKFSAFIKKADELRCDFVATGHYAKVVRNADGTETGLYRAVDNMNDQSYFLFTLKQDQLVRTLMPLGDLLEANVRKMAATFGVPVRPEGRVPRICFIDDVSHRDLIINRSAPRYRPEGPIVDADGAMLGRHNGLFNYRIAQRKVYGVEKPEAVDKWVSGFDVRANAVILGDERDLYHASLVATNCNWIGLQDFSRGLKAKAKIRAYHHIEADCIITMLSNNSIRVDFEKPQLAITPGQAIVFYHEDILLGGGWIEALVSPTTTRLNKRIAYNSSEKESDKTKKKK